MKLSCVGMFCFDTRTKRKKKRYRQTSTNLLVERCLINYKHDDIPTSTIVYASDRNKVIS